MFSHFTSEATIERMVKTGAKSSFSPISGRIIGHLRPLGDTESFIGLDTMANTYSFTCNAIEDIREGDRLAIGTKKYTIQGVKDHSGIRVSYTKAIIVENQG